MNTYFYEYKVVVLDASAMEPNELALKLNENGWAGWKLVTVQGNRYIFCKEKKHRERTGM